MLSEGLRGVIAAIITPLDSAGAPDTARLVAHAQHLLAKGCDALNLLGTTGEATSFSVRQRMAVMTAVAEAGLPLNRFMVGTGAAAIADAVTLARHAAALGYAGALVLPPFYYKPVSDDGIVAFIGDIAQATAASALPLYLYNIPAQSGIAYTVPLVARLLHRFGARIAGLKDSSGNIPYAEQVAALSPDLRVFPSNEAVLLRANRGDFAGCISATANLNAALCAKAYHRGDETALDGANAVRALFTDLPLVPGVKTVSARLARDPALASVVPPLARLSDEQSRELWSRFDRLSPELWAAWG